MSIDAIEIELFRNRFSAIAEEMGEVLTRAAFSPNIKERRDHSCAIFDCAGDMVAQAAHIPVHLGAAPLCVKAVISALSPRAGQTAIVNDPYAGGTHLPDITLVHAVSLEGSETPDFYVAVRAHHADVGGIAPGSLPPSTHIDEEGWRTPPVFLTDAVTESLYAVSRTPFERKGDMAAQVACVHLGEKRLHELSQTHGRATLLTMATALQDYAERLVAARLAAMGDVVVEARDQMDNANGTGEPIALHVRVTVQDGRMVVDFGECALQVQGPLNAPRAIAESAAFYLLLCLLPEETPANGGIMRRCRVVTRSGTIVDPVWPAAVAAGNVETSQRLVDLLFQAMQQIMPMPACSYGTMNNLLLGSAPGAERAWVMYETMGGGHGGGPLGSGAHAMQAHMTNTLNTPIEALEHAFPLRVRQYRVRSGSGGAGLHPGGNGLIRTFELLTDTVVTIIAERRTHGAPGARGGSAGQPGTQYVDHAVPLSVSHTEGRTPLPGKGTATWPPGSRITIATPGGGGFGSPP